MDTNDRATHVEDPFGGELDAVRRRLESLAERGDELDPEHRALVEEVLASSFVALEELQVAAEELRQQNEELIAAHNDLEASRRRYQDLFESAPDGYLVTDPAGVIRRANRAAAELLGVSLVGLQGKPLVVYVAEGDRAAFHRRLDRVREGRDPGGGEWEMRMRFRAPSSSSSSGGAGAGVFPAALTVSPIHDREGALTGLRWLVRDISPSKRAEERERLLEETRVAAEEARAANTLLRTLLDTMPAGVVVCDAEGALLMTNPPGQDILGSRVRGEVEAPQRTYTPLRPDGAPFPAEDMPLARAMERGETVGDVEIRIRREDGAERTILAGAAPVRDGAGQIVSGVTVFQDITARKGMEQQLRRQERLAAVGQLAAGIAHDFRNLLTAIVLRAEMPLRRADLPPDVARSLQTIVDESRKATDLVQRILDFSSRAMIERRPLDLKSFTGEVLDVLRRTIPENVQLTLHAGPGDCIVEADAGRMQQVLTNLALNARDAMPEGGELRISVERVTAPTTQNSKAKIRSLKSETPNPKTGVGERGWVCLSVSDTGTGMTEDVQAHLFEPFFTTKDVDQGTGLGLAQVYGIIRQHGGCIDVQTAEGKGTTFHIYLPATETVEEGTETAPPPAPRGRGETILLVEDQQAVRDAGRSVLESLGYRVIAARNGRQALDIYRSADGVDLVVTDVVMPQMGGEELVRELRRGDADLKAVGITGYTVDDVRSRLIGAGFLDVIHKPFEVDALARVVRRALDGEAGA